MGAFPTSLLSVVFQLYLIETIFADEQVRKAQEELRKRHLFYGDTTGEISPELTVALSVYQKKKGFPRTGRLDSATLASLGLMKAPVESPQVELPFVFAESGELRGPNGEALADSPITVHSKDGALTKFTGAAADAEEVALTTAGNDVASLIKERRVSNPRFRLRPERSQPPKATNPFVRALNSVDHAIKLLAGEPQPKKKRAVASHL
jgi:hypothetical protein